jgi:hypothetical protein
MRKKSSCMLTGCTYRIESRHSRLRGPVCAACKAGIYNLFTKGFDTADLKEAKAPLDELAT